MLRVEPAALDYARKHGLHALVVCRDGNMVGEAYGEGYDAGVAHALYSGTKSFWGIAAVAAQRDGILRLDEHVAEMIVQWQEDEWKQRVTLRQLLNLTSGIGFGGLGSGVPTFDKALAVHLKTEPGTTFTYGGIALQVFGAVFSRKLAPTKQTPHGYLAERILKPIGMRVERWRMLDDGSQPLATGAFVAAREWLKFGQFVCDRSSELSECFQGSAVNPRYGLGFWLHAGGAPADLVYASGAGGQGLYIVPSQRTVIVHFSNAKTFKHEAFLKRMFSPNA